MPATTLSPRIDSLGRLNLAWRITVVALLLAAEKFLLNFFVDFAAAQSATGLGAYVRDAQGNLRLRALNTEARAEPLRLGWLALHGALFVPLAALSYSFYGNHGLQW